MTNLTECCRACFVILDGTRDDVVFKSLALSPLPPPPQQQKIRHFVIGICFLFLKLYAYTLATYPVLEFLNNFWGLGTE